MIGSCSKFIAVVALTLIVSGGGVPTASAKGTAGSVRASSPAVATGGALSFKGKLPTKIRRSVTLQRKTRAGWSSIELGTTTRRGRFAIAATATGTAGTYTFRVKAPRKVTATKTFKALKTPTVAVTVTAPPSPPPPSSPPASPAPPPPPAPPAQGSRANPISINTPFISGTWGFNVGATDHDAWPEIMAHNTFNDPPIAGWGYVWVPVTFTYLGNTSSRPFSSEVEFVGGDGVVYDSFDSVTEQSCGDYPNDWSDLNELFPGASLKGNVCAVVPLHAIPGGLWRLSGDFGDHQQFVALG
jgi:hypothetical protein